MAVCFCPCAPYCTAAKELHPSCVVAQMLHVIDYLEEKEQICPCRDSELCLQFSSVDKGHKLFR